MTHGFKSHGSPLTHVKFCLPRIRRQRKKERHLASFDKEREAALLLTDPERSRALDEAAERWRARKDFAHTAQASVTLASNAVNPGTSVSTQRTSMSGRNPTDIHSILIRRWIWQTTSEGRRMNRESNLLNRRQPKHRFETVQGPCVRVLGRAGTGLASRDKYVKAFTLCLPVQHEGKNGFPMGRARGSAQRPCCRIAV